MSPAPIKPGATVPDEERPDDVGACLAAIRSTSNHVGPIDREDARAIYSSTCIDLAEWRRLDAAADGVPSR